MRQVFDTPKSPLFYYTCSMYSCIQTSSVIRGRVFSTIYIPTSINFLKFSIFLISKTKNSHFVDVVTTAGVGWTMAGLVSDQIGLAVIRETKDNKIQQQTSLSF